MKGLEESRENIHDKEGLKQKWNLLSKRKKILAISIVAILLAAGLFVFYLQDEEERIPVRSPQIVFDEGHGQAWSIHDTGLMGYSILASSLQKEGYRVSGTQRPLDEVVVDLSPGDIIVLPPGRFGFYTRNEIDALVDFVDEGGGIWVMAEWGNVFGMAAFQNRLLENFGVSVLYDGTITADHGGPWIDWMRVDVEGFSAENVAFWSTGILETWDGYENQIDVVVRAADDSSRPGAPIGMRTTLGKGRVMITADSHFLTNTGKGRYTVGYGDNLMFAKEVFQWLSITGFEKVISIDYGLVTGDSAELKVWAEPGTIITAEATGAILQDTEQKTPSTGYTTWAVEIQEDGYADFKVPGHIERVFLLSKPDVIQSRILFDESHSSMKVDDSVEGLLSFASRLRDNGHAVFSKAKEISYEAYDAVIFTNPRDPYSSASLQAANRAKYSIFIGDYCGRIDPETGAGKFYMGLLSEDEHSPTPPINDISSMMGVTITSYMIHDNTSYTDNVWNPLIETPWGDIQLYKSVVVQGAGDVFAWGGENSWGSQAWLGVRSPSDEDPSRENADVLNTTTGIRGVDFLAFGDVQPFTNQYYLQILGSDILETIFLQALNDL